MSYFFPRGNGPLVSVLLPTRQRVPYLLRCLDSCHSLAKQPELIEYLLKVDDDDTETLQAVEPLKQLLPLKVFVSPRGVGYHQMHVWVNQLAEQARGDWLFNFNDDAFMTVQDWDQNLLRIGCNEPWPGINDVCLLIAPTIDRPIAQEFFFLRRKTFELLGHVSLSPHSDNWIYGVMNFLDAVLFTKLTVGHLSHVIGDQTRQDSVTAYQTTGATLTSIQAKYARYADVGRLLDHLDQANRQREAFWSKDLPKERGWYWWKNDAGEIKHLLVLEQDKRLLGVFMKNGESSEGCYLEDLGGYWCPRA